jgi:BirA family biotin operon repressor/biotin-[acetyl-CoA-carboxylase] ligase
MAPLDPDRIFHSPHAPRHVGATGEVHDVVESTMDIARARLAEGAPDGYAVLAEHQSAGRGRTGAWECPPGLGLLMSVVLRLGLPARRQRLVVLMGAVAAVEALRGQGVDASIKWPNDVVCAQERGGQLRLRKLGGLIVERVASPDGPAAHVLGLGLNVNQAPEHLPEGPLVPATSMKIEKGGEFDRSAVCSALFGEMDEWYRVLARGQEERILARWRTRSCLLGHTVLARVGTVGMQATVVGLLATGEIILRAPDGRRLVRSDSDVKLIFGAGGT